MLKWKNRDVYVIRPHGAGNSWTDDLVVIEIAGSGEQEIVRKGDIEGWNEPEMGDKLVRGEKQYGTPAAKKAEVKPTDVKTPVADKIKADAKISK